MSKRSVTHKYRIGITCGDINGIGMEVILKTFSDPRMFDMCTPVVYGSAKAAQFHRKTLELNELPIQTVDHADKAHGKKLNFINVGQEEVHVSLGESTTEAGTLAFKALEQAVHDLASNNTDILVTAPINKHNIQSEDFQFPGHTEYLANYANEDHPLMILAYEGLRVGIVTGHIPLKDVSDAIDPDLILAKLRVFHKSLIQDFGIPSPKLAVLGLNPHAGDSGVIGDEERKVILPALEQARQEGMLCFGPYPGDGFFGSGQFSQFDGVLAMYHDQGLIPFKTLSFDSGVNYTAGLPIVRTSPDHGTAYDIAGKGIASEASFRQSIFLACDIYSNRKNHREMAANPLKHGRAEGRS